MDHHPMMSGAEFGTRFTLALRAIGYSRGRAAMALGVDKSLVGRWASGAVRPSDNNLSNITRLVAEHVPGFTMNDWERDQDSFARLMGLDPALASSLFADGPSNALPLDFLEYARTETQRRRSAYEGLWRTIRPSVIMQGKVLQDHGLIRSAPNGLLEVRMGGAGLSFSGWAFLSEGSLFAILNDAVGCTPLFLIFRGVPLPKATMLDGILLLSSLDAGRTPAAIPILLERVDDLSGDREADERRCAELAAQGTPADQGEVPEWIVKHLFRNVGPDCAAAGGQLFLTVPAVHGLSRGASPSGDLQG